MRLRPSAVIGLVLLASCQKLPDPTAPNNTDPHPSLVIAPPGSPVVGTPSPSPAPSPTPGPSPQPTPAPSPTPPPPQPSACRLGPGGGSGQDCPRTSPSFLDAVDRAIEAVVREHPEYFNLNDQKGAGGYLVVQTQAFTAAVVQQLEANGLCAVYDGEELAVKNTNDFNDQYDILLSDSHIRRGDGSYRSTCRPAWF